QGLRADSRNELLSSAAVRARGRRTPESKQTPLGVPGIGTYGAGVWFGTQRLKQRGSGAMPGRDPYSHPAPIPVDEPRTSRGGCSLRDAADRLGAAPGAASLARPGIGAAH